MSRIMGNLRRNHRALASRGFYDTHHSVVATQNDHWLPVVVSSNYGAVYLRQ